jgi:hypothetical protein
MAPLPAGAVVILLLSQGFLAGVGQLQSVSERTPGQPLADPAHAAPGKLRPPHLFPDRVVESGDIRAGVVVDVEPESGGYTVPGLGEHTRQRRVVRQGPVRGRGLKVDDARVSFCPDCRGCQISTPDRPWYPFLGPPA